MKRYLVYKFPAYHGEPKGFNFYPFAVLYGLYVEFRGYVPELKNTKTGEYKAYWL